MANVRTTKRKTTKPFSKKQAERIFENLRRAPPSLTIEDINAIDASLQGAMDGTNRRVALVALTKSGKELIELANKSREGAVAVALMAEAAALSFERTLQLAEIVKSAGERARIALCERKDMTSVIAEAKAGFTH
jgi:hypothetical protein